MHNTHAVTADVSNKILSVHHQTCKLVAHAGPAQGEGLQVDYSCSSICCLSLHVECVPLITSASLAVQMESEALSQREAALAANHASQQAELDSLLAKQEERLKAWEEDCAEVEASIEAHRKQLAAEEDRWACLVYSVQHSCPEGHNKQAHFTLTYVTCSISFCVMPYVLLLDRANLHTGHVSSAQGQEPRLNRSFKHAWRPWWH